MTEFGKRLRELRLQRGYSQEEFAEILHTSKQVISRYETGQRAPKITVANNFAEILGVSLSDLTGERTATSLPPNIRRISEMQPQSVPVIGSVAAGVPILAEQEYDIYIDSPVKADFALTVEGDSMEPTYLSGDTVFIREQPDVLDGQIAVVIIDDSAALKHVYHIKGGLQLVSENPKYPPMLVMAKDHDYLHILGLAVGFCRLHRYA